MKENNFKSKSEKVNFQPIKNTIRVARSHESYFDSHGCPPPNLRKSFFLKGAENVFCSGDYTQVKISNSGAKSSYFSHLIKTMKLGFKSGVLHLHKNK